MTDIFFAETCCWNTYCGTTQVSGEIAHPPLPQVMVRVKVWVKFSFRFMGGEGGG